jgi:hypothetical protein
MHLGLEESTPCLIQTRRHTGVSQPTFELAQVNVVDIKPEEELERKWDPFFCRGHYGITDALVRRWLFPASPPEL